MPSDFGPHILKSIDAQVTNPWPKWTSCNDVARVRGVNFNSASDYRANGLL